MTEILEHTAPPAVGFPMSGHLVRRLMPHRHLMLLLDRVAEYYAEERRIVGIKNVAQNDPVVGGHFPERPVYPASLLVEAMAQASGLLMNIQHLRKEGVEVERLEEPGMRERALEIPMTVLVDSKIRQLGLVLPGDQVSLRSHIVLQHGDMCQFSVAAFVGEREVARGEIMLAYPPYMT